MKLRIVPKGKDRSLNKEEYKVLNFAINVIAEMPEFKKEIKKRMDRFLLYGDF